MPSNTAHTNRLVHSQSPYLLQHAHNPVDWHPWGPEAFEKARRENKLIFLSVGYSTCHWCHVMARESFEDPEAAAIMNEHFVNIKVDREERPDVDRVYMTFVLASTGGGGWPMSVWLTPELKPIFGGTYFPPEDRRGMTGFPTILRAVAREWEKNPDRLRASGDAILEKLRESGQTAAGQASELSTDLLAGAYRDIKSAYDSKFGGFGGAPKFPRPVTLNFLLRHYHRTGTEEALEMVLFTLRKMAEGGIRDHLGGGFHRYSVDVRWNVPHFEKMLYDQAQLVVTYLEAYQITRDPFFAGVAREILEYVRRDLTGPDGEFYSAEDADSALPEDPAKHGEGAFYVWEPQQIIQVLGEETALIFNAVYGVADDGNVETDPHDEFEGKNILFLSTALAEPTKRFDRSAGEFELRMAGARSALFKARLTRPRPHLDDKALAAWNGLMISAFARAHQVLGDDRAATAAKRAAGFVRDQLYKEQSGVLLHRYRKGQSGIEGFAEDYAFFIQGLLDLYEAVFEPDYLEWAVQLQIKSDELFWDEKDGGYFSTTGKDPAILLQLKEDYDGAEPSPNSVAALNLLRLAQLTDNAAFADRADRTLAAFADQLTKNAVALPQMLVALEFKLGQPKQIVIAGEPAAEDTRKMIEAVHSRFLPNKVLHLVDEGPRKAALARRVAFIGQVQRIDGKATAYVCENFVCQLPTSEASRLIELLETTP